MTKRLTLAVGELAGDSYPLELLDEADNSLAAGTLPEDLVLADASFPASEAGKAHLESILQFYGAGRPDFENDGEQFPQVDPAKSIRDQILEFYAKTKERSKYFEPLGRYLHDLLFLEEIAEQWRQATAAATKEQPITTFLAIKPKVIRGLPWELILDDKDRRFIESRRPFARILPGAANLDQEHPFASWPIRLLVVVGCKRNDPILWRRELDLVEAAMYEMGSRVDYLPIVEADHTTIIEKLDEHQPHIFHFIGHGEKGQGDGCLKLGNDPWNVDTILQDFKEHCPDLRIAFVNCCHGNSPAGVKASWAVNEVFIHAKTRAVVGMQGDVLGEAAAEFSERVYKMLAAGKPIDVAVTAARDDIRNYEDEQGKIGLHNREWSLPQLYLSCTADQVLKFSPAFDDGFSHREDYGKTKFHVNRYEERRSLYQPGPTCWLEKEEPHICVVTGTEGAGKSDYVQRCLAVCKLRGHRVSYLDFRTFKAGNSSSDVYEILNSLVRGNARDLFRGRLKSAKHPFHNFYLQAQRAGVDVSSADLGNEAEPLTAGRDEPEAEMIRAFLTEARQAAQGEPLMLVFDNVEGHDCEKNYMRVLQDLAEAVSPGHYEPVRLVLVGRRQSENEHSKHSFDVFDIESLVVPLMKFKRKEFASLAEQFFCIHNHSMDPKLSHAEISQMIGVLGNRVPDPWDPRVLARQVKVLKEVV
jgi:hypothetical protein